MLLGMWEWIIRGAAVIAIVGFFGLQSVHDMAGHYLWLECVCGILFIVLMYVQATQILKWARYGANSVFRFWLDIKIIEPNPQHRVTDHRFTIQETYRVKPDPERIRVFHRANGEYFLQNKIEFWPKAQGKKWYADVHVVRVAGHKHDIVIARCSDDNLVTLCFFDYVRGRTEPKTGDCYPIPYMGKGPGFCILYEMAVPFSKP
jgi:hypothetical protein